MFIYIVSIGEETQGILKTIAVTNYTQVYIPQTNEGLNQTIKFPYFFIDKDEKIDDHLASVTFDIADDTIFVSKVEIFNYSPFYADYTLQNNVWVKNEFWAAELHSNTTFQPSEIIKCGEFVQATNDFWNVMHKKPVNLQIN